MDIGKLAGGRKSDWKRAGSRYKDTLLNAKAFRFHPEGSGNPSRILSVSEVKIVS